ncbi:TetR/AcrR family transcriptional regulator [Lysinibacillus sp. 54212]|uniref:TetR/AcrR family transcriptional regulator n=1 Tax=Lysinibacillus sp. 54212 TaxID=3119829 RepID=UPI002FC7D166
MRIREKNKEIRQQQIIDKATELFISKGLYDVQMQEIANLSEIGIATLFRYFPKKELLIVAVACQIMTRFERAFFTIASSSQTAFEKVEQLLNYFLSFNDEENKKIIRFREVFESYAAYRAEPLENIDRYQEVQRRMINHLLSIIEQGRIDGSINLSLDIQTALITYINCFGKFTAKLSLSEDLAELPEDITNEKQQQIMMKLILQSLKPL